MVMGPLFAESPDFWGLALWIGITAAALIVLSTAVEDDRFAPAPAFCCYAAVFFWWIATGLDNFVPDGKGPHTAAALTSAITDTPLAAGTGAFGGLLSMSLERGRDQRLPLARLRRAARPRVREARGGLRQGRHASGLRAEVARERLTSSHNAITAMSGEVRSGSDGIDRSADAAAARPGVGAERAGVLRAAPSGRGRCRDDGALRRLRAGRARGAAARLARACGRGYGRGSSGWSPTGTRSTISTRRRCGRRCWLLERARQAATERRARRRPGDGVALDDLVKAGARDFGDVEDGAVAVGLRKRGLLSRETRTAVGDRAYGLLDEWLRVGRRRFAEWSHDGAWTSAFLAGAGSAALLLDEPAALTAFADSKIAARLERAFDDLDLNARRRRPLGYHGRSGGGSGLGPAWTGLDSGGYGDGGDGGGGGGGGD